MNDAQEGTVEQPQPQGTTIESTPVTFDAATGEEVKPDLEQLKPEEQKPADGEDQTQARDKDGKFTKNPVQGRIDEITREKHEALREAEYWKRMAEHNGQSDNGAEAPKKPTPDQFQNYDDYVEALAEFKADKKFDERMAQHTERQAQVVTANTFKERCAEFAKVTPDFSEVVSASRTPIAQHVGELMSDSDQGAELAYHFAKNPQALMDLNGMSPQAAARAIGRLEAGFSKKETATAPPAPPTKVVTKTPPPAGASGSQGRSTSTDLGRASMDEYVAARKSQGASWAR